MQSDNGKLFIGGISWDTNEERLKEYFSTFGEVIEAVILKDRTTGRARGFGFVVFADPAVAEFVITEKHHIDGRLVEAKKAVPRDDQNMVTRSNSSSIQGSPGGGGPGVVRTRKIFVGGLPSSVTESDFKTYFEQFGTTTDVVVMYDHNTQRPRGFGFITYDSEDAVEKVLLKTFHELNGKMVEVKRAVPKEMSPSPARSPLGAGYSSYGVNRVNNLLNGYAQGFNPGAVGGYGLRMDGRFSPVGAGRSGFANFGSGYGMNMNFEQTGFGGGTSFNGNVDYGRGMSPYYIGNTNRFGPGPGPAVGYEGGNGGGGNSSFFSSVTRNLWGNNGGLNYNNNNAATNSNLNSNTYMGGGGGSTSGNNTLSGPFGNWGAPGGGGGNNAVVGNENVKFGYGESGFGLGTGGYAARNIGPPSKAAAAPSSSSFSSASAANNNVGYDGAGLAEFYGNGAVYSDPTWRSPTPETEGPASFSYGIGGGGGGGPSSDVSGRSSSPGYVGSYSVNKRQPNRGNLLFKT